MRLDIQIFSLLYSFGYGIVFYVLLEFNHKLLYEGKLFYRIVISFLFVIFASLLYFIILLKINNGILHLYFFISIFTGYLLSFVIYRKLVVKYKKVWYNVFVERMMPMAKKKINKRARTRMFFAFIIFGSIITSLSYSFFSNVSKIIEIKNEKQALNEKLVSLQDEEDKLNSDIKKLKDPEYVARYAREKYMYSKEGELIIRLPDDEDK